MVLALGALLALWGVRRLLAATGVYRWVWHPALFDMALYLLLLYALSRVTSYLHKQTDNEISMKATTSPSAENPWAQRLGRVLFTVVVVAAAVWAGLRLWDHYELAPWTRDGRVRANVVQIAPDVSGLVTAVPIRDNQPVAAGTLLFEVDRARYDLAVRQAQAVLAAQRALSAQAQRENTRNTGLDDLISKESREQTRSRVEQMQAAPLRKPRWRSIRPASTCSAPRCARPPTASSPTSTCARAATPLRAARCSRWSTRSRSTSKAISKKPSCPASTSATACASRPMGGGAVFEGAVDSVAAGIADHDRSTSANLLPSVNPTFNWVRLAQRVPVRIKLDPLPQGTQLVAGQTVTVQVLENKAAQKTAATTPAPQKG